MEKRLQKIEKNIQTCMNKGVCNHRWKEKEKLEQTRAYDGALVRVIYVLQCQLCGDIKKVDIE